MRCIMLRRAFYETSGQVGLRPRGLWRRRWLRHESTATSQSMTSGTMPMMISDASSDDWATVGVRVLSIALVPRVAAAR